MSKKEKNFPSINSLKPIEKILEEASRALKDDSIVIKNSSIPELLTAALKAGAASTVSFASLCAAGINCSSLIGATPSLATIGGVAGGGMFMLTGIWTLAIPIACLIGGYIIFDNIKKKELEQKKVRIYQEALRKQDAIIRKLKGELDASKERIDYLNSLIILLKKAVQDLGRDLESA